MEELLKNNQEPKPEEIKTYLPEEVDYRFIIWMKSNEYSRNYIKNCHVQILKLIGNKARRWISPEKIKSFLSKKNTLVKRSAIKLFLIFLEDMENITIKPFRYPRLKKESKIIKVVTEETFWKIFKEMRREYRLFLLLLFKGALRIGECVSIRVEHFNWEDWLKNQKEYGELTIFKAKRNRERIVPIEPKLMRAIYRKCPKHPEGALKKGVLFDYKHHLYIYRKKRRGYPLDVAEARYVEKVSRMFQICLREASIKSIGKSINPHSLRSSRATQLDEKGLRGSTIRDFLGHQNLSTTSRYIINTPEKIKQELMKADGNI